MSAATFTIFCFTCFLVMDASDGNYMTLSSSDATVGQPLTLQCTYVGTYTPTIIKFYFNMSVTGLQILLSSCTYLSTTGYNTALYDNPTCGAKAVSLIIKSVTQADIGTTWQCDASFSGGPPTLPAKSSIVIKSQSSSNSGSTTGLSPGEIAAIVIAIIIYVLVRAILIWLILTRKHLVDFIFVCTCAQGLSHKIRILIIIMTSIIPLVGEVILIYLLYKLWKELGLIKKEWILIIATIFSVVGVVILIYLLYKLFRSKEQDGTQNQQNRSINKVTPEPNDKKKSPTPNGRGDKSPPIGAETQNLVEAKMKKKKQKNGENTLENGSFEKDNNFLNEK